MLLPSAAFPALHHIIYHDHRPSALTIAIPEIVFVSLVIQMAHPYKTIFSFHCFLGLSKGDETQESKLMQCPSKPKRGKTNTLRAGSLGEPESSTH